MLMRVVLIEFGPGTGPFTTEIAKILGKPSDYFAIERDPKFVSILREKFPDLNIIEDSAEKAFEHYEASGIGKIALRCCVGSLLASLPACVQDGIIETLDKLVTPGV